MQDDTVTTDPMDPMTPAATPTDDGVQVDEHKNMHLNPATGEWEPDEVTSDGMGDGVMPAEEDPEMPGEEPAM